MHPPVPVQQGTSLHSDFFFLLPQGFKKNAVCHRVGQAANDEKLNPEVGLMPAVLKNGHLR